MQAKCVGKLLFRFDSDMSIVVHSKAKQSTLGWDRVASGDGVAWLISLSHKVSLQRA